MHNISSIYKVQRTGVTNRFYMSGFDGFDGFRLAEVLREKRVQQPSLRIQLLSDLAEQFEAV